MSELAGKIAIVTGSSWGIGSAAAQRIATQGATVICASLVTGDEADPQPLTLAHTVAQIRSRGGEAHMRHLDLTVPESRAELMDWVLDRFGRVDVLVNNSGMAGFGNITPNMSESLFREVFEVNLFGPRDLIVRALPGMIERKWGRIVNTSSTAADPAAPKPGGPPYNPWQRTAGISAYSTSRAAINMFTRCLAAELHGSGISVNTVAPVNSVITELVQRAIDAAGTDTSRFSAAESVEVMAEAILALCEVDPDVSTGLNTYSGMYLTEIGREVRGRDGKSFDAKITTEFVKYDPETGAVLPRTG